MTSTRLSRAQRVDAATPASRNRVVDFLRAAAITVVVLGHWIATLPRLVDGRLAETDHLLAVWDAAGFLTWVVQVVPVWVAFRARPKARPPSLRSWMPTTAWWCPCATTKPRKSKAVWAVAAN